MMDLYLTTVSVTVHYNGGGFCMHVIIVQSILVFIEAERFTFLLNGNLRNYVTVDMLHV